MGFEADCQATWQGTARRVHAHLDSQGLDLRGAHRLHLELAEITRSEIRDGVLRLTTKQGALELKLGAACAAWEKKILNPRSRIQKLGIKPGSKAALVGLKDPALLDELESQDCTVVKRLTPASVDALFLQANSAADLADVARHKQALVPNGALWVVRRKGKDASVSEAQVRDAARKAGLVDVKVVAFSDTHSAEKLVIPVADRPET